MKKRNRPISNPGDKMTSKKPLGNILRLPVTSELLERDRSVRIRLTVSGNSSTKKKIEGYLKKHLRSLKAVALTDSNAHYWINVIGVVDSLIGYNISYFIAGLFPSLREDLSEVLDESEAEMMSDLLDGLCSVFEHRIKMGPPDMLKDACEQIIKDFDENFLQQFLSVQEMVSNNSD